MNYRLGILSDLLNEDGTFTFPNYSLRRLHQPEKVSIVRIRGHAVLSQSVAQDVDFLISVPTGTAVTSLSLEPNCRLLAIVRVGVGCEDIDLAACTNAGVAVVLPAEAVIRPTAVAALTLMLALATRLIEKDRLTRLGAGKWGRRSELQGWNLHGKVLGLVGCGGIGSQFAAYARALGMDVIAFDPALSAGDAKDLGITLQDLPQVLSGSDYLSIHCPLNAETKHLIDQGRLSLMKAEACLINTARGGIVDQEALYAALSAGRLRGAALDVFDPEPLPESEPLLKLDNVIFSAHALNWTHELDREIADANIEAINSLLAGRFPDKIANPAVLSNERFRRKLANLSSHDEISKSAINRISQ